MGGARVFVRDVRGWASRDDGWDTYGNARFGFFVCYPRAVLKPQGESDNGDGNTFKSKDGKTEVVAYGNYPTDPDGGPKALAENFKVAVTEAEKNGYVLRYKMLKPRVYAFSGLAGAGTAGAKVIYQKTFETADKRDITLEAEYPASVKATMDPVVARMAGCLTAGKMEYQ